MKKFRLVETDRVKLKPEVSKQRADPAFKNLHGEVVEVKPKTVTIDWGTFNAGKMKNCIRGCDKMKGKTSTILDLGKKWTRVKWDGYVQEFMELVEDLDKL